MEVNIVNPTDQKWHRYHVNDLRIGDIVTMRNIPNRPEGVISIENNRLTMTVIDNSKPSQWIIFPDTNGFIPNITNVRRYDH